MPDYEKMVVGGRQWIWNHKTHGTLSITRMSKNNLDARITFTCALGNNNERVHATAENEDRDIPEMLTVQSTENVEGTLRHCHPPSLGYGDINLGKLCGKKVIFCVHHAFCTTAIEMGIPYFIVTNIVNENLEKYVCLRTKMDLTCNSGCYGKAELVMEKCKKRANKAGWT